MVYLKPNYGDRTMSQTTQKDLQRDPPGFEMHSFARNLCCQATNCDPDFLRLTLEALAWLKAHELPQMHLAIGYSNHLRLAKNGHCTQANRSHTNNLQNSSAYYKPDLH